MVNQEINGTLGLFTEVCYADSFHCQLPSPVIKVQVYALIRQIGVGRELFLYLLFLNCLQLKTAFLPKVAYSGGGGMF